jgi:hypothetical protein
MVTTGDFFGSRPTSMRPAPCRAFRAAYSGQARGPLQPGHRDGAFEELSDDVGPPGGRPVVQRGLPELAKVSRAEEVIGL